LRRLLPHEQDQVPTILDNVCCSSGRQRDLRHSVVRVFAIEEKSCGCLRTFVRTPSVVTRPRSVFQGWETFISTGFAQFRAAQRRSTPKRLAKQFASLSAFGPKIFYAHWA
jgi:hypothetical protein